MEDDNKGYDFKITISGDYYQAYITIDIFDIDAVLKKSDILNGLTKKNVLFGIKTNVIDSIVKNNVSVNDVLIASGIPHSNGISGEIEYMFEREHHVKPQVLDDGTVDFKNIGFVESIAEGQILARKNIATKAKAGTTVTNKIIKGKDGKDATFKFGKNVAASADGMSLIALCDGTIKDEKGKLSIANLLEIQSDVGIETGNIVFGGDVIVNGNVTSGYSIRCENTLTINGVVESADIHCGGDLIISMGIKGNDKASIHAEGNLISKFINSADVTVMKDLEVGSIMHSNINCEGKVEVKGKKGTIIGGKITSKNDVIANSIGTEIGVDTNIQVGISDEILNEFKQLNIDLKKIKEEYDIVSKAMAPLKKSLGQDSSNIAKYNKYKKLYSQLELDFTDKKKRMVLLNQLIKNLEDSKVKARTIYYNVNIRIGADLYRNKEIIKNVEVKNINGAIVVTG